MSVAKKCDRCGRFYEEYNIKNDSSNINGIMKLNVDRHQKYFGHDVIDLCPECTESFKRWLGGEHDGYCKAKISN